mmetsp:Transcript_14268/g.28426  ORF Transcript_14268/g.28426 Transcript_14268/m.28426 type:complete len:216 (-) Transcript_14268:377-1024(-)
MRMTRLATLSLTSQSAMRPTMFRLINTTTEHTRREEERPRKNRHMTNTPARAPSSVFTVRLSIVMNLSIHRKFWLKARAKPEPEGSAASLVAYISTTALSVSMVEKRNSICNFEVVMTDSSRMMSFVNFSFASSVASHASKEALASDTDVDPSRAEEYAVVCHSDQLLYQQLDHPTVKSSASISESVDSSKARSCGDDGSMVAFVITSMVSISPK